MKQSASVAIIGGGIIGASIAYNLAMHGVKDVVILDKSKAGAGSTSASLGGFRYQFSTELSVRLSQRSVGIIEKFKDLMGYDPLARRDGYVFIASRPSSFERLKKDRDVQRRLGVPVSLLSQEELQERYPFYRFDGILGGTFCREDGHASTMAVFQGYISRAKQLGAELYEDTEVTAIEGRNPKGFSLRTSKGSLAADSVVIAAGAYSGLVGKLASADIPIKPYPRKILIFGREGKGLILANKQETQSSFDLAFPPDYDEKVMQVAIQRVPATEHCSLSYANVGLYEMTPDSNPIVCEMPGIEGLYCCSGFAGHGFMHSPAIGELMAELITKGKTSLDISAYHMGRFRKELAEKESLIV
ncbi:MAG: FAD-binding oxidoreductase [Thaumarchaeota archaeon]|nr:MAG: FAD-binding oxidoreductase [Nitrososphaerota archaeon]